MPFFRIFDDVAVLDAGNTVPAGWTSGNFAAAVTAARNGNRPLYVRPGTYDVANATILTTNGGGKPIRIYATPGTATLRFTGGNYALLVQGVNGVHLSGLDFVGQNLATSAYSAPTVSTSAAGLLVLNSAKNIIIEDCNFRDLKKTSQEPRDSYKAQLLVCNDSNGEVRNNAFSNGDVGIWTFSSRMLIVGNRLEVFESNGIMVWATQTGGNHSVIERNFVNNIGSQYGDGQTGNCIAVYQAASVNIHRNTLLAAEFSGVRCNAASRAIITENTVWNAKETAIFAEAPGGGDMIGSIIADNSIDFSGSGINVANSGFFGDGTSRLGVVRGNLLTSMVVNQIALRPGPNNSTVGGYASTGLGISVEQDCVIQSNILENCPGGSIKLGVAQAARDLVCDGNLIRNTPVGIVFSNDPAASNMLITNNAIRGTFTTAIGTVPGLGIGQSPGSPLGQQYNANTLSQTAANSASILIADNRAV